MTSSRLALRRLVRRPGFAVLTIATLAIGFAATATILAVADAVLVRPLPFPDAERIVGVEHAAPGLDLPRMNMAGALYVHYREHATSFEEIGLVDDGSAAVSGLDRPIQVPSAAVTPSVFRILGVDAVQGRTFTEEEGAPGGAAVVVVSESFWERVLGSDPQVVGRRLEVDGVDAEVVGVLSSDFSFPEAGTEIWVPEVIDPESERLGSFGRAGLALLASGVTPQTAAAELARFTSDLQATFPDDDASEVLSQAGFVATVPPLREVLTRDLAPTLWLLLGTAAFVLLLAVVNVANLFLARAEGQQRESAIRAALGAGPGSFVRGAMVEGWWIALPASGIGLAVARAVLPGLLDLAPGTLPSLRPAVVDVRIAVAMGLLGLVIGAGFGLVALARLRIRDLAVRLRDGGRTASAGRGEQRLRKALVVTQVALASLLLLGAGLMIRSLEEVIRVEPGFETDGAASFRITLPETRAAGNAESVRFFERILERVRSAPGVRAAASTTTLPLSGRASASGYRLKDLVDRGENELPIVFDTAFVSPGYFEAMGIPLDRGRTFETADFADRRRSLVVDRTVAEKYWPGEDPIGRRIFPGTPEADEEWFEIVGVVGDVRIRSLTDDRFGTVYSPWTGPEDMDFNVASQSIVVRGEGDPAALLDGVRRAVWEVDPSMPLAEILTLDELVRRARGQAAFVALLLAVAAAVALSLAAVGTYGVLAYLVARRRVEFGVRRALGAQRGDVVRLVLREGLVLAAVGGAIGWLAGAGGSRALVALLYRVQPLDPVVFAAVPMLLLAIAVLACALPARRAASVAPVEALREG